MGSKRSTQLGNALRCPSLGAFFYTYSKKFLDNFSHVYYNISHKEKNMATIIPFPEKDTLKAKLEDSMGEMRISLTEMYEALDKVEEY